MIQSRAATTISTTVIKTTSGQMFGTSIVTLATVASIDLGVRLAGEESLSIEILASAFIGVKLFLVLRFGRLRVCACICDGSGWPTTFHDAVKEDSESRESKGCPHFAPVVGSSSAPPTLGAGMPRSVDREGELAGKSDISLVDHSSIAAVVDVSTSSFSHPVGRLSQSAGRRMKTEAAVGFMFISSFKLALFSFIFFLDAFIESTSVVWEENDKSMREPSI